MNTITSASSAGSGSAKLVMSAGEPLRCYREPGNSRAEFRRTRGGTTLETRTVIEDLAAKTRSRFELWAAFVNACHATHVAEVGVWKGEFAAAMLSACSSVGTYYMLDPWRHLDDWNKPANVSAAAFEEIYAEAMSRTEFAAERRRVLRGTTLEVIDDIGDQTLDFAYIDGDHTLKGVSTDLIAIRPKMRAGGFVAGDDFYPSIWQHGTGFEPTLVFPFAVHFALSVRATIYALPFGQFLIAMPGDGTAKAGSFVDLTGRYRSVDLLQQLPARGSVIGRLRKSFLAHRRSAS